MSEYRITHLAGSCRSGRGNRGVVTHAVTGWSALCGKKPGRHSAGWSEYDDKEITCAKCQKALAQSNRNG